MPKKPIKKRKREEDYRKKPLSNAEALEAIERVKAETIKLAPDLLAQFDEAVEIGEYSATLDNITLPKPNLYGLNALIPLLKTAPADPNELDIEFVFRIIWVLQNQDKPRPDIKNPPQNEIDKLMISIKTVEDFGKYSVLIKRVLVEEMEALKKDPLARHK